MTKEEILYETGGLIYTEHPKVIQAMTEFAEMHVKQLILSGVVQRSGQLPKKCVAYDKWTIDCDTDNCCMELD